MQAELAVLVEDDDGVNTRRRLVELLQADGRGVAVSTVSEDAPVEIDVDAAGGEAVAPGG